MTEHAVTQPIPADPVTPTLAAQPVAQVVDLPDARAVIARPVGAIVTDTGHVFAVEPVDVTAIPVRVHCQQCPWRATAHGLAAAATSANRHAAAHLADPR